MSTISPTVSAGTRTDPRTLRRFGAAVLLPIGPLAVAILRGVLPYNTQDTPDQMITNVAADLGGMDAVIWLGVLAMLTLVPSTLAAVRLAQRRAPLLSLAAVVILVPSFTALFYGGGDTVVRVLAGGVVDHNTAVAVIEAGNAMAAVTLAGILFILGHIVGLILLGAALWRARVIPVWAAVAVIVSQPLHLVFAVFITNHFLDACSWGLAAVGLGMASIKVLRTANDDWDLAPATTLEEE